MLDSPYLAVLGRLHPMVLHLPIGVLVALLVLEALAMVRKRTLVPEVRMGLAWLAAACAAASVLSGLTLSRESSYTGEGVQLHQWLGIATGVAAVVCAVMASVRVPRWVYVGTLLVAVGLLVPAGHLGAELTHGENFVLAPLSSKGAKPGGAPSLAGIDPRVVGIFKANCVGCHNEVKFKGGLALDSVEGLRNGGDGGAVVVPGNAGSSEMMIRLTLTPGDKEHMPPPGKKALSAKEIETIRAWIEAGAPGMEQKP